jgi:glycine cleavage system H lipoate-binding protein
MAADMRFAKTHEWIRPDDGGLATVGISAYAVEALTDLVFMQLPAVGRKVKAGESIGEIESVKGRAGSSASSRTIQPRWATCSTRRRTKRS